MKKIKWFLIIGLLPLLMPILVILILASAVVGGLHWGKFQQSKWSYLF